MWNLAKTITFSLMFMLAGTASGVADPLFARLTPPALTGDEQKFREELRTIAINSEPDTVSVTKSDDIVRLLDHAYGEAWPDMWPYVMAANNRSRPGPGLHLPAAPPKNYILDQDVPVFVLPKGPYWSRDVTVIARTNDTIATIAQRELGDTSANVQAAIATRNSLQVGAHLVNGTKVVLPYTTKEVPIKPAAKSEPEFLALRKGPITQPTGSLAPMEPHVQTLEECGVDLRRKDWPVNWSEIRAQLDDNETREKKLNPEGWSPVPAIVAVLDSGISKDEPERHRLKFLSIVTAPFSAQHPGLGMDATAGAEATGTYPEATAADPGTLNHGTHVAGIIQGAPAEDPAIRDVLRNYSQLFVEKVVAEEHLGAAEIISLPAMTMALEAAQKSAKIINLSLKPTESSWTFSQLRAMYTHNVLVVVAAGNGQGEPAKGIDVDQFSMYPTVLGGQKTEYVIAVAATQADGRRAPFSNYGMNHVDVAAPGVCISSFSYDGSSVILAGTSQAAPFVALTASLLQAYNFDATAIKQRIISAVDYDPASSLKDETYSGGTLNIRKTIAIFDDVVDYGIGSGERYAFGALETDETLADDSGSALLVDNVAHELSCILKVTPLQGHRVRVVKSTGNRDDPQLSFFEGALGSKLWFRKNGGGGREELVVDSNPNKVKVSDIVMSTVIQHGQSGRPITCRNNAPKNSTLR